MQPRGADVRRYASAVLMSLVLLALGSAQVMGSDTPLSNNAVQAAIRIDNFGRVDPTYYRGAQPKGRDYADLAALGVKTVIDLTENGDPTELSMARRAGMNFFRIPMTTRETPTAATIARFLQLVNDPANQPVFVHCQGGRHRTGVMTAVYRMTKDGWTSEQAFAEMKQYHFGADFLHPEFKQFVYSYRPATVRTDASGAQRAKNSSTAHAADKSAVVARRAGGR